MKKPILLLAAIGILLFTSCKDGVSFFGKAKQTEAKILILEKENADLKAQLEAYDEQQMNDILNIRSDYEKKLAVLQKQIESGNAKEYSGYFVVVGSFKNKKYADKYAAKIKEMGYEGNIVNGPNNFYLVTSGTYTTLKTSLEPMRKAREILASEAWVFFK